jgi:hypothetical protein
MRYTLCTDDIGNYLIVDSYTDLIISKIKNEKIAIRITQKINKNDSKERNSANFH